MIFFSLSNFNSIRSIFACNMARNSIRFSLYFKSIFMLIKKFNHQSKICIGKLIQFHLYDFNYMSMTFILHSLFVLTFFFPTCKWFVVVVVVFACFLFICLILCDVMSSWVKVTFNERACHSTWIVIQIPIWQKLF